MLFLGETTQYKTLLGTFGFRYVWRYCGMRGIVAMLMLVLAHISVWAQSNEDIETILEVLGVMNIEEADGEEVERL